MGGSTRRNSGNQKTTATNVSNVWYENPVRNMRYSPSGLPGSSILTGILVNYTLDIQSYLLRFGVFLCTFWRSKYLSSRWARMSRANPPHQWIITYQRPGLKMFGFPPLLWVISSYISISHLVFFPGFPFQHPFVSWTKMLHEGTHLLKSCRNCIEDLQGFKWWPSWNYQRWSPWKHKGGLLAPQKEAI